MSTLDTFISHYTPRSVPASTWSAIRPQVVCWLRSYFERTNPQPSGDVAAQTARVLAQLTGMTYQLDYPLEPETVLSPEVIEHFVFTLPDSQQSKSATRARLMAIGKCLNPDWNLHETPGYVTDKTSTPYTESEQAEIVRWAGTLSTPARREHAGLLVALALGAGLRSSEITNLTTGDVHRESGAVIVTPHGYRGAGKRIAVVDYRFEDLVLRRAQECQRLSVCPAR